LAVVVYGLDERYPDVFKMDEHFHFNQEHEGTDATKATEAVKAPKPGG
jgi:hypothetical protein